MATSMEQRLALVESAVTALERQAVFFQNTVIAHNKEEGKNNRRIFDKLDEQRRDMHEVVDKLSSSMAHCRKGIEEDMSKYYAKREHAITPAALRNWMLFAVVVLGSVISVTLFIVSK